VVVSLFRRLSSTEFFLDISRADVCFTFACPFFRGKLPGLPVKKLFSGLFPVLASLVWKGFFCA